MLNFNRRRLREKVRADRRGAASCWLSAHLASHPRPPAAGDGAQPDSRRPDVQFRSSNGAENVSAPNGTVVGGAAQAARTAHGHTLPCLKKKAAQRFPSFARQLLLAPDLPLVYDRQLQDLPWRVGAPF
jgi:hypothetical protein